MKEKNYFYLVSERVLRKLEKSFCEYIDNEKLAFFNFFIYFLFYFLYHFIRNNEVIFTLFTMLTQLAFYFRYGISQW